MRSIGGSEAGINSKLMNNEFAGQKRLYLGIAGAHFSALVRRMHNPA
jgi:hypothetical protein